jgi:hypothetical protein
MAIGTSVPSTEIERVRGSTPARSAAFAVSQAWSSR